MKKLSYKQIKHYFHEVRIALKDSIIEILYDEIESIKSDAYDEAIELRKNRTISALADANVNDQEIIRIVKDKWDINEDDVIKRLLFVKRTDAIKCLRKQLKLQGYSQKEIKEFMIENIVATKIRNEKDL